MRRVVLDTNVVLDCWVFEDPSARALKAALESGRFIAVRSDATDLELMDVLERPQFGLDVSAQARLLEHWRERATLIDVADTAPVRCTDPDDQKFLDLALAAKAVVLFTKDNALLATAKGTRVHGLSVMRPDDPKSVLFFDDRVV